MTEFQQFLLGCVIGMVIFPIIGYYLRKHR